MAAEPAHLFPVNPVNGAYQLPGWVEWGGKGEFRGKNPPEGAVFTVWVKEYTGDELKIEVQKNLLTNLTTKEEWKLKPLGEVVPILEAGGIFNYARSVGMLKG